MGWQVNKGFLLWKEGTSLETPWKPTPWLSTWGNTSVTQKWHQVTFPSGGPHFAQAFAKYCFYHWNQARASGSHHCRSGLMSAPGWRAVRNFQPPHRGTSFPGIENISQLIKTWHLRSGTKRSNPRGNWSIKEVDAVTSSPLAVLCQSRREIKIELCPRPSSPHATAPILLRYVMEISSQSPLLWMPVKKKYH